MTEAAAKKPRPTTLAIRIFQVLLLGLGIGWAFTLSGEHLDQMQVPGFLISLAISWWLTPEIRARAMKLGLVDKTADEGGEQRKIHKKAVPRLGGVAIYISIVVTLVTTMAIGGRFPKEGGFAGIAAGGTLIFVLGLMDDLDGVPAKNKLVVQILAAMAAYSLGVRIEKNLPIPFEVHLPFINIPYIIRLGQFALPLTVVWLVGITNAVNLIDGMDGLAAGVSAIAAVTIWAVAMANTPLHTHPAPYPALTAAIFAGALLGFLRWNFNPARIFLGDSGAYLTGFVLGCIAITGVMKVTTVVTVGLPLVILFFPLVDTSWAVVRRLAKRQSIFSPDAQHIHHRLLQTGMSQKSVAYVIYAISGILGLFATAAVGQAALVLYIEIMACVLVMALFFAEVLNRHRQRPGGSAPPDEPTLAEPADVPSIQVPGDK
ncbi:MAG TPA: MraY family glycosyltransferase [Candidatus Obscuribacterales bacterium]